VGVPQLLYPLAEGEQRPQAEDHEGDHERPEVPLPPIAEGVLDRRRPARPAPAEEQQALVGGVRHRVQRLGEHRGRAGRGEADELGDGDAQVGEEGGDDRLPALLLHAGGC
jgi:hypothetical protein